MKKVCIRGIKEHPEKVIEFLKIIGFIFCGKRGNEGTLYYYSNGDEVLVDINIPIGYTEITFADACAILDGKAILNDDCTVTYKESKELPHFPCEMWVWDDDKEKAKLREVHAHVPTLKYTFVIKEAIAGFTVGFKNASLTDPRIEETITIEEAEKLLGKKIRR